MKRILAALAATALILPAAGAADGVADAPERIRPLLIGSGVPGGLTPKSSEGAPFDLESALKSGPHVLIIYRGGW